MTSVIPPCKDAEGRPCSKREAGCHIHCGAYQEYRLAVEAARKKEHLESSAWGYVASAVRDTTTGGGARLPSVILKDAQRREERRFQNAASKVNKKSC